jgi:hypothetical protein
MKKNVKTLKFFSPIPLFLTLLFCTILFSCTKKEILTQDLIESPSTSSRLSPNSGIPYIEGSSFQISGNKLNPYTVKNMRLAWQTLANNGYLPTVNARVFLSHYYVKFKPKDSDEYELLTSDSTLAFSDLPIESNISLNGDYYHDPSLPDSVPTFQYTAVKVDYSFPEGIEYEILGELYIPEVDVIFNYENGGTNDLFVDRLLNQAYLQTNNFDDMIPLDDYSSLENYTPGGRIRVFDTRLPQWIGMEGVRVQARRWFIWYNARPDYTGFYRMAHSFKRPCNYSIWFATGRVAVRHNVVNTTFWINGPKQTGDWNYDLNNSYQRFAGHVFRGAYRYTAKDIGGLQRPWNISNNSRQVYVAVDGVGTSGTNWIVLPIIKVWRYKTIGVEYNSDEIFSTTCHETGHTSHKSRMDWGIFGYWQVSRQLQESWAVALEWYVTGIEYRERGILNYGNETYNPTPTPQYPNTFAYQYWNSQYDTKRYTPIYIDIVDNFNQHDLFFSGFGFSNIEDVIIDYNLPYIEQYMLKHIYGLSSLTEQLITNRSSNNPYEISLFVQQYE